MEDDFFYQTAMEEVVRLGGGGFMTEFGAMTNASTSIQNIEFLTALGIVKSALNVNHTQLTASFKVGPTGNSNCSKILLLRAAGNRSMREKTLKRQK